MEISTGFWSCSSGLARLSGRFTGTPAVSSGAVTMKMISSTSITSTSGVTLISAIGARRRPVPRDGSIATTPFLPPELARGGGPLAPFARMVEGSPPPGGG